jgi:hypothetical protein
VSSVVVVTVIGQRKANFVIDPGIPVLFYSTVIKCSSKLSLKSYRNLYYAFYRPFEDYSVVSCLSVGTFTTSLITLFESELKFR